MKEITFGEQLKVTVLPTGNVKEITYKNDLVSGFIQSAISSSVSGVYIRLYKDGKISSVEKLIDNCDNFFRSESGVKYVGKNPVNYTLSITAVRSAWFISVETDSDADADILYVQDIGVGERAFILNNELYAAQYLGHSVVQGKNGYAVTSVRNSGDIHPALCMGAIRGNVIGYSTDGAQFFGRSYTVTEKAENLFKPLPNEICQYEMPLVALCAKPQDNKTVFYGVYFPDGKNGYELNADELKSLYGVSENFRSDTLSKTDIIGKSLNGDELTRNQIEELYPERILCEYDNGELLSFFKPDCAHVVTQKKEKAVMRPHGHIMLGGFDLNNPSGVFCNTSYMYGAFMLQTAYSNVNFNRLTGVSRGFTDHACGNGLRIFIKRDGKFRRLKNPSVFEMGLNYARYIYVFDNDTLTVDVFSHFDSSGLTLTLASKNGTEYDYYVTFQAIAGENEYHSPPQMSVSGNTIEFVSTHSPTRDVCPDLNFSVTFDRPVSVTSAATFFEPNVEELGNMTAVRLSGASFKITVGKNLSCDFNTEKQRFKDFYSNLLLNIRLDKAENAQKLYATLLWFCHDALVHYASPHGLEQTGGAAWGTRDVCQGPVELFLSLNRADAVKDILVKVFSAQNRISGEWSQWFMFDGYGFSADDCHGDVVFWPLKALGDYLKQSGDLAFLNEKVAYSDKTVATVCDHVELALNNINGRFFGDSGLISYAGGDWNDTLQPVNEQLKNSLCSVWTMALGYETLFALSRFLPEQLASKAKSYAERIKRSLYSDALKDGIVAGFVYNGNGKKGLLLHPDDIVSGINYRLLSLTRTVIADIFNQKQNAVNMDVINKHLLFPDGARLMDRPPDYNGANSKIFVRAEQAANVGREIGLMYSHAHIRYVQAAAKMSDAQKVAWGLNVISPILIKDAVLNAETRQSNCYYSSSDADFATREQFKKNYALLRKGEVAVRGGWRVYSSGGGIYIARVIKDMLGFEFLPDGIRFRPLIAKEYYGLTVSLNVDGKKITVKYNSQKNGEFILNGEKLSVKDGTAKETVLPYDKLKDENIIEVY